MMGWWQPHFFVDVTGVEVLFSFFPITGFFSFLLATAFIALLCAIDRWIAWRATEARASSITPQEDNTSVLLWSGQRLTGGLIMLLMMSFNFVLFIESIVFLGVFEWLVIKQKRTTQNLPYTRDSAFAQIPSNQYQDEPSLNQLPEQPTRSIQEAHFDHSLQHEVYPYPYPYHNAP